MKKFLVGFLATIGSIVVLLIFALIVLVKSTQVKEEQIQPNTILYLDFANKLVENKANDFFNLFGQGSDSLYHLIQAIDQASLDPQVKGIVARLDHAEMGLAQAQEVRNAIMRFRALARGTGKFTIAHADTFGESGPGTLSFYLASAFDEIWLQPLGQVGLVGIYMEIPFAKEAADAIGLEPQIGKREKYKTMLDSLTETGLTEENRESLQAILNSLMGQIIHDIALGREINANDVEEAVNRGPLLGQEALDLGIIDKEAYFDEVEPYANSKVEGTITFMSANNYLAANPKPQPVHGKSKIALIFGLGAIHRDIDSAPDVFDVAGMSSGHIVSAFQDAANDEDVSAIVFRINSPGGSPVASETILRAVRKAQQTGIPVIVSMSDLAGSGGYWIAAYADKIVANPSTITGSIGVIGGKIVLRHLWEKLGINWEHVQVGDNAGMWSFNQTYTASGWERLNTQLDYTYNQFIDRVAEGRKLPREHVEQVAKGRIWSGEDALKYSLVDRLGDLKDAIDLAKEMAGLKDQIVAVDVFPKPKTFAEKLQMILFDPSGVKAPYFGGLGSLIRSLYTVNLLVEEFSHSSGTSDTAKLPFKRVKG